MQSLSDCSPCYFEDTKLYGKSCQPEFYFSKLDRFIRLFSNKSIVQWRRNPSPRRAWCDSARNCQKLFTWPGKLQRNNAAITSAHPHGINTSPDGANHSSPPHANLSISHFTEGKIKSYFATSRALIERGERPITKASALERLFNHRYYISQKAMRSILEQLQLRDSFSCGCCKPKSPKDTSRCAIFARLFSWCSIISLALLSLYNLGHRGGTKFGPSTDDAERCRANLYAATHT